MNLRSKATIGLIVLSLLGDKPAIATPSLTTSSTNIATTLDLDGTGNASTHIVKIADVRVLTDDSQGLTLTIGSGSLSKPGGSEIPFQVTTVADGAGSASASDFTAALGNSYSFKTTTAGTRDRDVYIRYTSATLQDPGNYRTSITLTVSDN